MQNEFASKKKGVNNVQQRTKTLRRARHEMGVRRYQNKDGTLTSAGMKRYGRGGTPRYTSWSTKRRQKNAETQRDRARAEASQKFDDAYRDYAKKTSTGKAIAGNLLMGAFGYKTYAMARSSGESRGKAAVRAVFDLGLGFTPFIPQGISIQRHNIRENYIDKEIGEGKGRSSSSAKSGAEKRSASGSS